MTDVAEMQAQRAMARIEFDKLIWRKRRTDERLDGLAKEIEDLSIEIDVAKLIAASHEVYPDGLERADTDAIGSAMDTLTKNKHLAAELDRMDVSVRRRFRDMSDDQKGEVERAFMRHLVACGRTGVPREPLFLAELVGDVCRGIHEPEMMAAATA